MSEDLAKRNGALWQRWFDEVWAHGKADVIGDFLAEDAKIHPAPGATPRDVDWFKDFHAQVLTKFDRVQARVHDPIAMGDWISVRTELLLIEKGSGEEVSVAGLQRARLRDGKFAEVWDSWDWMPSLVARETVAPDAVDAFLTAV